MSTGAPRKGASSKVGSPSVVQTFRPMWFDLNRIDHWAVSDSRWAACFARSSLPALACRRTPAQAFFARLLRSSRVRLPAPLSEGVGRPPAGRSPPRK